MLAVALAGCQQRPTRLVEESIAARGGEARLRAIQSLRLAGKVAFGARTGTLRVEFKRPNRMRMEVALPEGTLLRLYDGSQGWTSNAAGVFPVLQPMSEGELSRARREADMDGPLLDSAAKGIRVALAGTATALGKPADALDVTFPDGTVQRYYLDASTHQPLGWDERRAVDGKPVVEETRFRTSRRVEGVLFPEAIDSAVEGSGQTNHITLESIELNPPLPDGRFHPG